MDLMIQKFFENATLSQAAYVRISESGSGLESRGQYTQKEIASEFGLHYSSISKIVKKQEMMKR